MNLHDALRQTTRFSDAALEHLPCVAALVDPALTLPGYRHLIVRHAGHALALYETLMLGASTDRLEHELLLPTFRPDALCADLGHFGIGPTDIAYDDVAWLAHADADVQLGVLYVHLGATQWARLVVRHLQRHLDLTASTGAAYFHAMAEAAWAREALSELLQGIPNQGKRARAILSGARQACFARQRWLADEAPVAIAS